MNTQNNPLLKTYLDFEDHQEEQDDEEMGPWKPNPKNIYATMKPKPQPLPSLIYERKKNSQQKIPRLPQIQRQEKVLEKKPQTQSLQIRTTIPIKKQIKQERILPLISKQYVHKLRRQTHLPIITARDEYGDMFKYSKPVQSWRGVHDQLRHHSFKKNNRYRLQKSQTKLMNSIEALISKQSRTYDINQKCIIEVKKKPNTRKSFKLF